MQVHAITKPYLTISNSIVTEISVENPYNGKRIQTSGIWDTGATNSCISKKAAEELDLKPVQRTTVMGVHGSQEVNAYYITFILPNENIKLNVPVTECNELSGDGKICALIGMDVITKGDFCITNVGGQTVMSFRVPSITRIDFVDDIQKERKIHLIHQQWMKSGNDKCPCGSGKKYKNCHGKNLN